MTGCCADKSCTPETCMCLPVGYTCRDCVHHVWCEKIIGKSSQDDTCDFFPRRFCTERKGQDIVETKACKTCGASIIWAESAAGKSTPLDSKSETLSWVYLKHGQPHCRQVRVHRNHFATCPNADQHRKKEG